MRANTSKAILAKTGFVASILLLASGASFAQNVVNLTAAPTQAGLPDGQSVPMWGYTCGTPVATSPAICAASNPFAGTNWSPVVITVPTNPSGPTSLTINLTNSLSFPTGSGTNTVPTSLVIVGQLGGGLGLAPTRTTSPTHGAQGPTWPAAAPSTVDCTTTSAADAAAAGENCPPGQPDRVQSFATEVAAGATTALIWSNLRPGTYLIHSGTHPSIQSPMGLYGVLVVTTAATTTTAGTAYPLVGATPAVTYNAEVPLVLSEIDPVQNRAVDAAVRTAGFIETNVWSGQPGQCGDLPPSPTSVAGVANTCYPPAVNYDPRYYLINGASFDRTNASRSLFGWTPNAAAGTVLVRFVNAGLRMHVPSIVGVQTGSPTATPGLSLMAEDGNVLPGLPKVQTQVFLAAGKTYDVSMNVPASGTPPFAVYDRQLSLSTNNQRDGGMQGYIAVTGATLPTGPTATAPTKTYFCVPGVTLDVTDPSKGLLAGATAANGALLVTPTSLVGGDSTLVFQSNGTFTYTPPSGDCGGSFSYLVNGTLSRTATITRCDAGSGCAALGGAPTAVPDSYTSTIASRLQISPPGVLANDTDPSRLPLTAALVGAPVGGTVTLNADGSFTAVPACAPICGVGVVNTMTFQYNAVNSQKTASTSPATVTVNFGLTGAISPAVLVKDAKTGLAINDYRWIIEEDRTFYIDPRCQIASTNPLLRPAFCGPLPIPSLATNFHTSHMGVVASGCVGTVSCEAGQTLVDPATQAHNAAVCDVGNGVCRTDASQKVAVRPSQVALDPTKRYYISILPGDGVNPVIGGAGGAVEDPPGSGTMRQFDIAKECGPYTFPPSGAWEVGGPGALCGHAMGGAQIAAGQTTPINILLQQTPLPTAKIAVYVFQDDAPLNGEVDAGGGVDVLALNEPGLGGFELKLFDQAGAFGDSTGQITYDMFNMPVSNALAGTIDPVTGLDACPITKKTDGLVGMIPTCPKFEADGLTLSPLAGQALIANLYPGLYEVVATPGADRIARGEEWLQTNTLDGTKPHEAFIKPNEPGYFQEFGPGGFHVAIGFANPAIINARKGATGDGKDLICSNQTCTTTVSGVVTNARMSRTPDQRVYSSGSYDSYSFTQCYVSFGDPSGADFAFTKCNADGTFTFANMPTGNFRVTVFDQWNDLLVDGLATSVLVAGSNFSVEIPVTQWRTNLYTRTFLDVGTGAPGSAGYGDGVSNVDPATGNPVEPGLTLVSTNIRYRDGSFAFFNNTDLNGFAGFNEVFPFLNWLVVETDTTRYKQTGAHVVYDAGGPVDCTSADNVPGASTCQGGGGNSTIAKWLANTTESPTAHLPTSLRIPGARYCATADCTGTGSFNPGAGNPGSTARVDPSWAKTQAWQGLLGQNSFIEWGMKPFAPATGTLPAENGGIKGHVIYHSTRPFDDPSLSLQLSWEPLVPNVTINLYQVDTAQDGTRSLRLVDTTKTTSWDDWAQGFRRDANGVLVTDASGKYVPNMSCPGQEVESPFYFTLANTTQWLNPTLPIAENSRFKCYDGWSMLNQVQPAPYDGMYKFPSVVAKSTPTGQLPTGDWLLQLDPTVYKTNCTICTPNPEDGTPMLPAGKYVVEVIVPPGYELVKEEDKNILLGDVYIAPVTQQFAGLGNIFIMPDQAAVNAFYNKNNQLGLNKTTNLGAVPRHEGDTGSIETFWPCVGATRIVPDWMSLYPTAGQNAPFAGASRPLCDRKEVILKDEMSVLAKFFIFSSTHIAGKYTGTMTNDFASEFDPFSPQFGEKFSLPNLPVAFRDFAGNEMSRTYSDQWGVFNGMTYSTYGVNPPNPTGYVPQMMIACMNDPGPIPGPSGTMMTDPLFSPAYSNFCYETPFMPGATQYMDTPVIPTQAFADAYNLPDCEYPDTTPAIKSVLGDTIPGSSGQGPWVSGTGNTHVLTITALGDKTVTNNAYSGPRASTEPYNLKTITRHYGFGSTPGTVSITNPAGNPVLLGGVTWSDTTITAFVPAGVCPPPVSAGGCHGQLVITAANGKQSIDTVTVTVGGKSPTYVTPASPSSTTFGQTFPNPLQTAIDNATPGDLIIVGPGSYKEMLLMWKPVRLQGVGANSVTINADAHPAGKMDAWRKQVVCLFGLTADGRPATGAYPGCPVGMITQVDRLPLEGIVGWDTTTNGNLAEMLQEPTLMGAYEGAGITVLGKGVWIPPGTDLYGLGTEGAFPAGYQYLTNSATYCGSAGNGTVGRDYGTSNFLCNPSRIDGFTVTNSSQGGGGIFLHAWNHGMEISNNRVYANHGTFTGGITVTQGEFPDPFIIADATNPPPPGLPLTAAVPGQQNGYGFNRNVRVHHNSVTANASIGDALYSGTPSGAGGVSFCSGSDSYKFDHNWICGNLSTGDGGGVAHVGFNANGNISNNYIVFNQSANPTIPTNGGGLAVFGAAPDRTLPDGTECGAATDVDCSPGLSEGTGPNLVIDANLFVGNSAESGTGGGIRVQTVNGTEVSTFPLLPLLWYDVTLTNNIIANNVAGWDGGGVSLQDALKVNVINNTVIANDTTGSAGVLFNTLGAPLASTPPPGCNVTGTCPALAPTSVFQPAGFVTMQHTPNLIASLPPAAPGILAGVNCPVGHGAADDGLCRTFSIPVLANNIFWQNRAFHITVGDFGSGLQNQQHLVGLVPLLNQTTTGECSAGTAPNTPNYWDIGVRGDTSATTAGTGNPTLTLSNSIVTSFSGRYNNNGNLAPAAVGVVQQYCNGARMPPERCSGVTDPLERARCLGYNVPPGRSEVTGLSPVFTMNNITPAATVDEGNNWINLAYGPLGLWSANAQAMVATNPLGPSTGSYSILTGSPAHNGVPFLSAGTVLAPGTDFFGNTRPKSLLNPVDIGAVEFVAAAATLSASVTPSPLAFGNWATGTTSVLNLTVTNTGNSGLTGLTFTFAGGTPQPYSRSTAAPFPTGAPNCGTTLAVGASCTVKVQFAPTTVASFTRTLTVGGATITGSPVTLTGAGVAARATVSISPNPLTITLATGVNSGSGSVTLTNTAPAGGAQMTVTGVTTSPTTGGFTFTRPPGSLDTCTGATLAPGASCNVSVTFTNTTAGRGTNRPGTITFTDNAQPPTTGTGSQSGALTGFATP